MLHRDAFKKKSSTLRSEKETLLLIHAEEPKLRYSLCQQPVIRLLKVSFFSFESINVGLVNAFKDSASAI